MNLINGSILTLVAVNVHPHDEHMRPSAIDGVQTYILTRPPANLVVDVRDCPFQFADPADLSKKWPPGHTILSHSLTLSLP